MRNRFQTKKQLYVSQRAIALHLIRPSGTFPSKGKAKAKSCRATREQTSFAPNTETFSAVYNISVGYRSRLARSPGGLGGRSHIEFIVSPLPRRRHNESHFAAQSPERSFFFPLFLSAEKEKEVIGDAVTKSLSPNQKKPPTPDGINNISFFKSFKGVRGDFFQKIPRRFLFIH